MALSKMNNTGMVPLLALLMACVTVQANDFMDLSLEELVNLSISIASKRAEPNFETASATFVLTHAEIQQSGARRLPDVLRLIPGVQVAQISARHYAISIRGFNSAFSNKLLVLVDGRSIYDISFSGVVWDSQDLPLEIIERIEVIRGPGAALWGSNAVNGVINIITRSSQEQQGNLLASQVGSQQDSSHFLRHGGSISPDNHYQVFAKFTDMHPFDLVNGQQADDRFRASRIGFRSDNAVNAEQSLRIQGEFFEINSDGFYPLSLQRYEEKSDGGNLLMHWQHTVENSKFYVSGFYDVHRIQRKVFDTEDVGKTTEINVQQSLGYASGVNVTWGMGYQNFRDKLESFAPFVNIKPLHGNADKVSVFLQSTLPLDENHRCLATLGARYEHSSFFGDSTQPSARLAWKLSEAQFIWMAYSIAERVENRGDADNQTDFFALDMPGAIGVLPNDDLDSEKLRAVDLGYRVKLLHQSLSLDLAAFYYEYDDIMAATLADDPNPFVEALIVVNNSSAISSGAELTVNYFPLQQWKMQASFAYIDERLYTPDNTFARTDFATPDFSATLRSSYAFSPSVSLAVVLRYVSGFAAEASSERDIAIDEYLKTDISLYWSIHPQLRLTFAGRNLGSDDTVEYQDFLSTRAAIEVPRELFMMATLSF